MFVENLKNDKMANLRIATKEDFKKGTILITSEGYEFVINTKYDEGIWYARGLLGQGEKCMFENEARFYKIKTS